jgi:hypothetical protein
MPLPMHCHQNLFIRSETRYTEINVDLISVFNQTTADY